MTDALAAVRRYIDAFDNSDEAATVVAFDDDAVRLDGTPQHVWQEPLAQRTWYRDVMAESAHLGATHHVVTVDEPLHDTVTADSAAGDDAVRTQRQVGNSDRGLPHGRAASNRRRLTDHRVGVDRRRTG